MKPNTSAKRAYRKLDLRTERLRNLNTLDDADLRADAPGAAPSQIGWC